MTSQLEILLKDTLTTLKSLSQEPKILLGGFIEKAVTILSKEIRLLSSDCREECIKTEEILSELRKQKLYLGKVEPLHFRIEMTTRALIQNSDWKLCNSNELRKMTYERDVKTS